MGIAKYSCLSNRVEGTRPPCGRWAVLLAGVLLVMILVFACNRLSHRTVLFVQIGSELVPCADIESVQCLVVNGEVFRDTIEGFTYEEGYIYRLRVEREDLYPNSEPPLGFSKYRYRLIDIVDKEPSLRLPGSRLSPRG